MKGPNGLSGDLRAALQVVFVLPGEACCLLCAVRSVFEVFRYCVGCVANSFAVGQESWSPTKLCGLRRCRCGNLSAHILGILGGRKGAQQIPCVTADMLPVLDVRPALLCSHRVSTLEPDIASTATADTQPALHRSGPAPPLHLPLPHSPPQPKEQLNPHQR